MLTGLGQCWGGFDQNRGDPDLCNVGAGLPAKVARRSPEWASFEVHTKMGSPEKWAHSRLGLGGWFCLARIWSEADFGARGPVRPSMAGLVDQRNHLKRQHRGRKKDVWSDSEP